MTTICFLCQLAIPQGKGMPVTMRPICRLLGIEPSFGNRDGVVSLIVCGSCYPRVLNLEQFAQKAELSKMMMKESFRVFYDILCSGTPRTKKAVDRRRVSGGLTEEEKIFREKLINKCAKKVAVFGQMDPYPRVVIRKEVTKEEAEKEDMAESPKEPLSSPEIQAECDDESAEAVTSDAGTETEQQVTPQLDPYLQPQQPPVSFDVKGMKILLKSLISSNFTAVGERRRCDLCPKQCFPQDKEVHLCQAHPDQILFSVKQTSVSDSMFKEICLKIMEDILASIPKEQRGRCIYCPKSCWCNWALTHHLYTCHGHELVEKVINAQEQRLEVVWQCNRRDCTHTFSRKQELIAHYKEHHFIRCTYCELTFRYQEELQRHMIQQHPDHVFRDFKDEFQSQAEYRKKVRELLQKEVSSGGYVEVDGPYPPRQCPYCDQTCQLEVDMKIHLAVVHRSELAAKLRPPNLLALEYHPVKPVWELSDEQEDWSYRGDSSSEVN